MLLPPPPFLYPVLDEAFSYDLIHDALEVLRAGSKILQIRAKQMSNRKLLEVVKKLTPASVENGSLLIINDRVDLSMISDAAGVHLGQEDFPVNEARALLPGKIIGLSTHTQMQVLSSRSVPIDYIAVGPIYSTTTKANADPIAGVELIRFAKEHSDHPVVAIGGIKEKNFAEIINAGASGIALISELYQGPRIYDTVRRLLDKINQ